MSNIIEFPYVSELCVEDKHINKLYSDNLESYDISINEQIEAEIDCFLLKLNKFLEFDNNTFETKECYLNFLKGIFSMISQGNSDE